MAIIDKNIRIFRNGVWVDFSATNGQFFTMEGPNKPFANARFFNGVDWCIPCTRSEVWNLLFGPLNQINVTSVTTGTSISRTYERIFDGNLTLQSNSNPSRVGVTSITNERISFHKYSSGTWEAYLEFTTGISGFGLLYVRVYNT